MGKTPAIRFDDSGILVDSVALLEALITHTGLTPSTIYRVMLTKSKELSLKDL